MIDDHYAGEARTLTSDAEANLLKLAEPRGRPARETAPDHGILTRRRSPA